MVFDKYDSIRLKNVLKIKINSIKMNFVCNKLYILVLLL